MRQLNIYTLCFIAIGKHATTRNASEVGVNDAIAFNRHNFVECVEAFKGIAAIEHASVVDLAKIFF
jgi:hypothetical protein